ncbi:MAG: adenylate/guanylate cyclase domain-containing protein, partial [Acidimicrobiia bacterium]
SGADPRAVVGLLNEIFSEFDDLAKKHGVEKIKTIGDAYMAASGLSESGVDDTEAVIEFAMDLLQTVKEKTWPGGEPVRLRIGIHTGPAVAGVIGHERFIYDLWGDSVNFASRMEATAPIGGIQVTEEVRERVARRYQFEQRHEFPVKGKGMTVTFTLITERPVDLTSDSSEPEAAMTPRPIG